MKKFITLCCLTLLMYKATAQVTSIPDPIFEQVLINSGIDSDGLVNGQMVTIDAVSVTSLVIASPNPGPGQYITDLTGLEAFINLESLTVNRTMVEYLDVSGMPNLKHLDCVDNALTHLDVSNNILLEYLNITSGGDVHPFNNFSEIDLSNNPNITELVAWGELQYINLKNGNNNPGLKLKFGSIFIFGPPEDFTPTHTCIEVDDEDAAQNDQFPYNEWTVFDSYHTYNFTETCLMGTDEFHNIINIVVYPNPASDILYFGSASDTSIDKVILFDLAGRAVKEYNTISGNRVSVAGLAKGMYIIQILSGAKTQTQKIIIE